MDIDEFRRTGLVRLPGAVTAPEGIAGRIWAHLAGAGILPDRPGTWTVAQPTGLRAITASPEFRALGSPAIRAAADELLGAGCWPEPRRWGRPLVTFPTDGPEWNLPTGGAWHNDFVPLRHRGDPRALQIFVILSDLPPGGGGTLVLTGSHHLVGRYLAGSGEEPHPRTLRRVLGGHPWLGELFEPARAVPAAERIGRFMAEGARVDGVDLRVVELTGAAGDAFVMHCDTFHAVAPHRGSKPRLMATTILCTAH